MTAEVADGPVFWPLYLVLSNRGELAVAEGDTDTAAALYERSLDLARAQQDGFRSVPLRLGQLALDHRDLAKAHDYLAESLVVGTRTRQIWLGRGTSAGASSEPGDR